MIKIYIGYTRDEIRSFLKKEGKDWQTIDFVSREQIEGLAVSTDFFSGTKNFIVSGFPENKDNVLFLENDLLKNSENEFHFESLVPKSYFSKKLQSFIEQKKSVYAETKKANSFALSDAVFSGGAQDVWLAFNKLKNKFSLEEIHGVFLWSIKTVLLSKDTKIASSINSFTLQKIKGPLSKQDSLYLKDLYEKALTISVRAHLGQVDFSKSLESLILTLPR